ncbi:sulfotransferase family protein [Pseudobythopirellula maris]|nr:sulfotransferase [Pseudobythopirellula maris]
MSTANEPPQAPPQTDAPAPQPPSGEASPPAKRQGYGAEAPHEYGLITPRFWHGMKPADWTQMLVKNRFALSPRGVFTTATILGAGVFHVAGGAAQSALNASRIRSVRLDAPPLFVLGHWRSGTTMLHELLIRDPRHTYPTTYECFCPHHFLVSEDWFTRLTPWLLPKTRPMDNVATGWERPQEDEFALCSMGLPSPYRTWAFPKNGPVDRDWLTLRGVSASDRQRWIAALQRFVKTIAVKRHGRMVLKSPPHTARIKALLEAFPDARFVHIARDPRLLFPSTVRLWRSLCDVQGVHRPLPQYDWIEPLVLDNLAEMYDAYGEDIGLIPEGRLVETTYERLVEDPKRELRAVYDGLDLGGFDAFEPNLDAYLGETSGYRTNRYEVPDAVERLVRERWGAYAERFGYA